jgi:3-dehydroquinate synthase
VVALGGGAVGDLSGFVAATYMRGMNFVQVPTTLLAQVDASIGGKTAIDHPRAKNLIGAFHQPRLVVVDPAVLGTLPEREFRSGLAEIIKHGIVLDAGYFEDLEASVQALVGRDLTTLERVVAGSCRLKAGIVERDEQEAELRWVLNYGHTVGHAIEAATGFRVWTHGEAVSLGIAAEARLAERLGIGSPAATKRQVSLLAAVGLPVAGIQVEPAAVVEALSRDKKSRDGRIPFVLAPEIGSFRVVSDVPRDAVLDVLKELV